MNILFVIITKLLALLANSGVAMNSWFIYHEPEIPAELRSDGEDYR